MVEKVDLDDLDVGEELKVKARKHDEVTTELYNTFVEKNHDYGDSFSKTYKEIGEVSALTRICDKINRLKTMVKNDEMLVDDEKKEDTIKDAANYLIMWVMNLDEAEVNLAFECNHMEKAPLDDGLKDMGYEDGDWVSVCEPCPDCREGEEDDN